jgi:polyphosphate kinase 2 (PPK2 family)
VQTTAWRLSALAAPPPGRRTTIMRSIKTLTAASPLYEVLPNGALQVARQCPNILAEYRKDGIPDYLAAVDHSLKITDKKEFKQHLRKQMKRLNKLAGQMKELGLFLVIALQGRDGAGKTGTVDCINEALYKDAKRFRSVPIGPPTQEELAHPYLWRMSKYDYMPEFGQGRAFDRSWQERVLVEKVMNLTPQQKIEDSYAEIRHFEWGIVRHGGILIKLWLDITYDTQGERFKDREKKKPGKKSSSDDVARAHWDEYTPAANELFHRTGTADIPQHIISSEDKDYCHITVLEIITHEMKKRIKAAKAAKKRAQKKSKKK